MKAFILTIELIIISFVLHGQELTGKWSGALEVQGTQLRIVFHVNKVNNQYKATMDSPDQNVSGINVTAINFSYPDVRLEISSAGAVYEGTMSDEKITGKWAQSGTALFLVLSKREHSSD